MEIFPSLTLQLDISKYIFLKKKKSGVPVRVYCVSFGSNRQQQTHPGIETEAAGHAFLFIVNKRTSSRHRMTVMVKGTNWPFPTLHFEINRPIKRRLRYDFCSFIHTYLPRFFCHKFTQMCLYRNKHHVALFWYC